MSATMFVLAGVAALGAMGVLVTLSAWTAPTPGVDGARLHIPDRATRALVTVLGALIGLFATGWLVGALAGGSVGWVAFGAIVRRRQHRGGEQDRVEALAVWCEQLRDLLAADIGIIGTIDASVATVPAVLRPEVSRLSTRLAREAPQRAIGEFTDEVDDPSADLIGSVLLLSMSHSGRTSELLSELAATIRERATMRLRVESERAGQRSEARFVLGFGVAVIVGVVVFGRGSSFLDAYDDPTGQFVLLIVAALYGGGMWWLRRLVRFDRPTRFLQPAAETETSR